VNVSCVAFALTLLSMAGPVLGVVCEFVCAQPRVLSSSCHGDAADGHDGPVMSGELLSCGDAHLAARVALFTGATPQGQTVTFIAGSSLFDAPARLQALVPATSIATHAPPGPASRSTISFTTLLRI
jgi:hypothetical protein